MTNELINTLKKSLRGKLVLPGDANYDTVRKVYNGMIDKRPAMIAQCLDNLFLVISEVNRHIAVVSLNVE